MRIYMTVYGDKCPQIYYNCCKCDTELEEHEDHEGVYVHPDTESYGFLWLKERPLECENVGKMIVRPSFEAFEVTDLPSIEASENDTPENKNKTTQ